jgi:chromosome segregation ATPase
MKPSEAINALKYSLAEVEKHLPQLDNSHEHVASAEASLKTIQDQKVQAEQALKTAQANLDRTLSEGQEKIAVQEASTNSQLKHYQDQIVSAQATLDELTVAVNSRRTEHDQILSSMESLKKRFA